MIKSEIRLLEEVIIHKPGSCIEMITPEMIDPSSNRYMLVDDILCAPIAKKEHDVFTDVLSEVANVISFSNLLSEVLQDHLFKENLIFHEMPLIEELTDRQKEILMGMEVEKLIDVLISGCDNGNKFFESSPNLVFARDIGLVIGNLFVTCSAAEFEGLINKSPRKREMALMSFVAKNHPFFKKYRIVDINENAENKISIEGGDFLVVSKETIAIGISERTMEEAIDILAPEIFEEGFKNIVKVYLPKNHGSMHLDTVFTVIGDGECVIFKDLICQKTDIKILSINEEISVSDKNLIEVLKDLDIELKCYLCGGENSIAARREQWTDGANMLAIAPGVVISYDRNYGTCSSLEEGGYKIISADEFCKNSELYLREGRAVITIPSGELSRGRGGPRCMSMPVKRA